MDIDDAFEMLDREKFSIKELQGESLPLGVDSEKIEVALTFPLLTIVSSERRRFRAGNGDE